MPLSKRENTVAGEGGGDSLTFLREVGEFNLRFVNFFFFNNYRNTTLNFRKNYESSETRWYMR